MKSLRLKLVLIIAVLVAALLVAEGCISMHYSKDSYEDKMDDWYEKTTAHFTAVIDGWMLEEATYVNAMESMMATVENDVDLDSVVDFLTGVTDENEAITMAYIGFTDGSLINGSGWVPDEGWDCRTRGWYTDAVAAGTDIVYGSPYVDDSTGNITITVSNHFSLGDYEGVAAVDIDVSNLMSNITELVEENSNDGDYLIVAAANGDIIYHPNEEFMSTKDETKNLEDIFDGVYATNIEEDEFFDDYDGTNCCITAEESDTTGWTCALVSPSKYYNEEVDKNTQKTVVVMIIATIIAVIVSGVVGYWIATPIANAAKKVKKLAADVEAGHGNLTESIDVKSKDEVGVLVGGVNALIASLAEVIREINGATDKLASDVETLETASAHSADSVTNISATMEEMSASSEETSATTSQVTGQINDIANLTFTVNNNTMEKENEIDASLKKVNETKERIKENDREMADRLERAIELLNANIKATGKVEEIREMTQGISSVASQTNLLSLNASIEAARAGEMGRGFAVVAGEIGNLANNSANMAKNIQAVSDEVLEIVSKLVKAAEEVSEIMLEISRENTKEKNELLEDYSTSLQNCYDAIAAIAENSNEIAVAVDAIRGSMDAIDIAVEENSQGITTIATGSTELVNSSNDVLERAHSVGEVSERLQKEVNKFII